MADGSIDDLFLGTAAASVAEAETEEISDLKDLEDIAHQERALISSDALRFINDRISKEEREDLLRALISRGRASFPLEDGWLIINLDRIQQLYTNEPVSIGAVSASTYGTGMSDAAIDETGTEGTQPTGSLAEAILAGNATNAYALIDHRPMVSLAAAAYDLDTIYRLRKGEEGVATTASELLKQETAALSTEQLGKVIKALTSALDGTYQDERSAVKMAILKALQILSEK